MSEEIAGADFYHNAKPLAQAYALAEVARLNLSVEVSQLKAQLEQARREEMEACCKDVCLMCKEGKKPVRLNYLGLWSHVWPDGNIWIECEARQIRQRWQKQGQGQEQ